MEPYYDLLLKYMTTWVRQQVKKKRREIACLQADIQTAREEIVSFQTMESAASKMVKELKKPLKYFMPKLTKAQKKRLKDLRNGPIPVYPVAAAPVKTNT